LRVCNNTEIPFILELTLIVRSALSVLIRSLRWEADIISKLTPCYALLSRNSVPKGHEPLQKHETKRALWPANQDKAPGPDGLPMSVWREVWPVLRDEIMAIMSVSLQKARLPDLWKKANIIPLRKAGKDDHTSVKSYRPISLLQTISKVLESVVAERVSYLVETNGLLPRTHFGTEEI